MPRPIKFEYAKRPAFRDASLFLIVCEGRGTEPVYFRFFEGVSSRVKVVPVPSGQTGSSPENLIPVAETKLQELNFSNESDRLWFVIDTDRWRNQIRNLRDYCANNKLGDVVQSNPCFEVWLYHHFTKTVSPAELDVCSKWKPFIPQIINGGFNPLIHPVLIEDAVANARENYRGVGDTPVLGSTQLWNLGESLLALIKKDLDKIKASFLKRKVI